MKKSVLQKFKLIALMLLTLSISPQVSGQNKKTSKQNNTVVLYVTRHGKTILNTMDRVQGWADTPLTPEGVEVAKFLGLGIKDVNFKAAYSSDLGRARQTARIVLDTKGQQNLGITEVPQLRETNFGSYEGDLNSKMWGDAALYLHYKSSKELFADMSKNPEILKRAMNTFKTLETLGIGENYEDVKARGQKAIREIAEKEYLTGGGNILVVAHGMAISVFLSDLDSGGKKISGTHMGNAAVSKVIYKDGKFTIESFGDMSYVEKGKQVLGK
ncbi:probable phosphoglycerate mutase [Apibacter mensalis]|uniref:Probable phosphoglycerate mutase n=1 Tax=Apibacter mensalis TaxID=1586267 RepID=A0A0X8XXK2_9FLAO|nr:histidine phosphatase family protein [Apibacter mensalis]CVK15669.1 probable phosphoglycerate mutase [Apibacter mensalis]